MGTVTVNGKQAQVIFQNDFKYQLRYRVRDYNFEEYNPVDREFVSAAHGKKNVNISLNEKPPFIAQVISYETNAPVTGDIEVAVSLTAVY